MGRRALWPSLDSPCREEAQMKKTYKYTFLTLSLALAFIFGSMAATNLILYIREGRLLAESGIVAAGPPMAGLGK